MMHHSETTLHQEILRLKAQRDALLDAAQKALPYLEAHTDMGPVRESWKSDALSKAISDIEQAIKECE